LKLKKTDFGWLFKTGQLAQWHVEQELKLNKGFVTLLKMVDYHVQENLLSQGCATLNLVLLETPLLSIPRLNL